LKGQIGTRTVSFPSLVQEELEKSGMPEEERKKVVAACAGIAQEETKAGKGRKEETEADAEGPATRQLVFLGPTEVKGFLAGLAELKKKMPGDYSKFLKTVSAPKEGEEGGGKKAGKGKDKPSKEFYEALRKAYAYDGADIALFGRMTTSDAFEDVEAAMEVAHAISTNEVTAEVDYFTAVDDIQRGPGAAYLEEGQYNSATFYKYFSLDWSGLLKNLAGDVGIAAKTLAAFFQAAALTTPTGKRNSFAHCNRPDGILAEVKPRLVPTNYANAFLVPAKPYSDSAGDHDIVADSIRKLSHYVGCIDTMYGKESARWWCSTNDKIQFTGATVVQSLDELIRAVLAKVQG
jgi:CRISPR system Cascade subunit CasC